MGPNSRRFALVIAVLSSSCNGAGPSAGIAAQGHAFDRYELRTGSSARQTILAGFFRSRDVADIAILERGQRSATRVRLFAFQDGRGWAQATEMSLPDDYQFVDASAIAERHRLITYGRGMVGYLDPDSGTVRALVRIPASFPRPRASEVPHVDITHDLNADGLDDLVIPVASGFALLVQRRDGTFAEPVIVTRDPDYDVILGAGGYRYDPWSRSRVFSVDWNGDGLIDLAYWDTDHFAVHEQAAAGTFAPSPARHAAAVPFSTDEPVSLSGGAMSGRALHSVADLNNDGTPDLVIFRVTEGNTAGYSVHHGQRLADGRITFADSASRTFGSPERLHVGLNVSDVNGDEQPDLIFTTVARSSVRKSWWKRLKGMLGDDVRLQLEFYRQADGSYGELPDLVVTRALDGIPSHREPGWVPLATLIRGPTHVERLADELWPRAFDSMFLLGDVNGDRLDDVVIGQHPRELELHTWSATSTIQVAVPNDGAYGWLFDLDRDGRKDVLLHHVITQRDAHGAPVNPPGTDEHRLLILLSR